MRLVWFIYGNARGCNICTYAPSVMSTDGACLFACARSEWPAGDVPVDFVDDPVAVTLFGRSDSDADFAAAPVSPPMPHFPSLAAMNAAAAGKPINYWLARAQ